MADEVCWNCLHPVRFHADGEGCISGRYALTGTLLSMTGCACALQPADANTSTPPESWTHR